LIKFSKKYNPLFQILKAKGVDENHALFDLSKVDTVLISGGRDSGKSFALSSFVGVASSDYNHRILYTRQTMSSTDNSITSALDNRLEMLGVSHEYEFANNNYTHKLSNGKITITGQKTSVGTQTAKLKSLEDYSIFITDEGEELTSYDEWVKIKRSMRATDVQCLSIISFNPPTKTHWLYKTFYESVPEGFNGVIDNILYIHTNYIDNGQENMAPHNWLEYERLKEVYENYLTIDPKLRNDLPTKVKRDAIEFKNVVLGSFRDVAEGVIFSYNVGEFPEDLIAPPIYGMDQGYTHPTAVVKVHVDKKEKRIYLKEIFYKTHQTNDTIYEGIKDEVGYNRIWCDSAVPMFIKELKNKGLYIREVKKPKIVDSINTILNYDLIIDKNSVNLQRELDNYRWSDKRQDEPIDDNNHAIDAFRYAVSMVLSKNQSVSA
jgi:phage terminase large subunit